MKRQRKPRKKWMPDWMLFTLVGIIVVAVAVMSHRLLNAPENGENASLAAVSETVLL